jgi:putative aldouronate transport system permease protein
MVTNQIQNSTGVKALSKSATSHGWGRESFGEHIFRYVNALLVLLLSVIMLFPFYTTIINSISPGVDFITKDIILLPSRIELTYYRVILGRGYGLLEAYKVTILITVVGTLMSMVATVLTSYALAQKSLPFRTGVTMFFVFTIYFSGGLIPTYLVVRGMGMLNTYAALIVPGLIGTGIMLLLRNFFMTIPRALIEAARIDGCSEYKAIPLIILPLSMPAIATFTLFYGVRYWNTFFDAVIYISDIDKMPLQVFLRNVIWEATLRNQGELERLLMDDIPPPSDALKAAAVMATTLPIIFLYPFLQRFFVKGIVVGSLKG